MSGQDMENKEEMKEEVSVEKTVEEVVEEMAMEEQTPEVELTDKEKKLAEKQAKKEEKEKAKKAKFSKKEQELMAKVDELEDKIQSLEEQVADGRDKLLRLAAEYDNSKKRAVKDLEDAHKYGATRLMESMVTVMDNIDMALASIKEEHLENEHFSKFVEGVKMIATSLETTLGNNGLKKCNPINEKFDPKLHEAMMMQSTTEVEDGTIMMVFQPGYELNSRMIRHAKVIVAKNDSPEEKAVVEEATVENNENEASNNEA